MEEEKVKEVMQTKSDIKAGATRIYIWQIYI